jgi:hypothetical protein
VIEVVTCRCCGKTQDRLHEGNPAGPAGCKCSRFWCIAFAKCVAHCPGLLVASHACSSFSDGRYEYTFSYRYGSDPTAAGWEKKDGKE